MVEQLLPPQLISRRMIVITMVIMLGIAAITLLNPSLRITFARASEQMTDVPRWLLLVVIAIKAVQTIASTLSWRNVLQAAFPDQRITFRHVFLVEQSKDALSLTMPSKVGAWAMLSGFRLTIPGAQMPTILAAWSAQSIGFMLCGALNTAIVALLLPGALAHNQSAARLLTPLPMHYVWIAGAIVLGAIVLVAVCSHRLRERVAQMKEQLRAGFAIIGSPRRYVVLVLAPCLISYACRYGITIAVMSAFGIPITPTTVMLALAAHQVAGAIRFTPGGFGPTQAIDVMTLHAFAASSTVTAYSITQGMLMTSLTLATGLLALLWAMRSGARPIRATVRTRRA